MKTQHCWTLCLLLALAIGCGGPARPTTAPVSGIVTLDGTPVEGASVMFMPVAGGRPALGSTDAAGKFTLMTFKDGDGALVGEHQVTVTLKKITGVTSEDGLSGTITPGEAQEIWIVPERYSQPDKSGLKATVAPRMPEVKLELSTTAQP